MAETYTKGYRRSALDQLSPDNRDWLLKQGRYAPRFTAAATLPAATTSSPGAAPMSVERTRQLRAWGLSREQIADLAELAPGDLAKILPTDAELEAGDRMGPGAPDAVALIVHKAEQARVQLPPDWRRGGAR